MFAIYNFGQGVIPRIDSQSSLEPLQEALSKNDLKRVIQSPDLFWLAFCQEATHLRKDECFSTSISAKKIVISGRDHIISNIRKIIEVVRGFFAKGIEEKKAFSFFPIKIAEEYFVVDKPDVVDLTDWVYNNSNKIYNSFFEKHIRPCMGGLSETVGARYLEKEVVKKVISIDVLGVEEKKVKSIYIEWVLGRHCVYPIPAKPIPPRENLQEAMYGMYKKQICCDFSLVAKEGVLKVHSSLLYAQGGEVMQKILTSNMKESIEKTLSFKEYSLNTVKWFIEFIYLGEKGLNAYAVLNSDLDLYELLGIAHLYQLQSLMDCCTNLLSLSSSVEDLERIEQAAEFYDNAHLKELSDHFQQMKV